MQGTRRLRLVSGLRRRMSQANVSGGCRRRMSQGAFYQTVPQWEDKQISQAPLASQHHCMQKYAEYEELLSRSLAGGGARGIERHVTKNKKMLVRERMKRILDPMSPFLEIGGLGGFGMPYGDLPGGGMVAGVGLVQGVYCMLSGNDATVKAGTYYPITVRKSGRVQAIAQQNRLPTIYLPDSGGAFLPLQSEIFIHGGRGFYNQAVMCAEGTPQVALVCGSCTAGGAYNPTMSEEAIIVDGIGKIFLGGPPLVKAATGEIVSEEDLGGAFMHSSVSGCTDYYARTEEEAFIMCRDVIESLNMPPHSTTSPFLPPKESGVSWEELVVGKEHLGKGEVYGVLAELLDGSNFKEFKAFYGPGLITATGYLQGKMVGVVANTDEILGEEASKGAHFLNMCDRRDIPLIFLQNSLPSTPSHQSDAGGNCLKSRAAMCATLATLSVPTISLTLSSCAQQDHLLMCGPSFNPNLNFAWPSAKWSKLSMGEGQEEEMDALSAAANILVDAIVTPQNTRAVLGEGLRIVGQQKSFKGWRGVRPVLRM